MIEYRTGNCLNAPELAGECVLVHVVNDAGRWGAGFSGALEKSYPMTGLTYQQWAAGRYEAHPFGLGRVLFEPLWKAGRWPVVAHLCAMRGVRRPGYPKPLVLSALDSALLSVSSWVTAARMEGCRVVMPRIGCGLAGGTWAEVEPLIQKRLGNVTAVVYSGEGKYA